MHKLLLWVTCHCCDEEDQTSCFKIQAIELALEQADNASAESTIFLDDSTRNIAAGHQKGLTTVLVSFQRSPSEQ